MKYVKFDDESKREKMNLLNNGNCHGVETVFNDLPSSSLSGGNDSELMPIENLIHIIRGQQTILDSDLAKLYGVETRALNQAVKCNIERFPADFMFQLTKEEAGDLGS